MEKKQRHEPVPLTHHPENKKTLTHKHSLTSSNEKMMMMMTHTDARTNAQTHQLRLFAMEQGGKNFRRQLELEWVGKGIVGRREPSLKEMVDAAITVVPEEALDRT
uniref:Uncharacterized protein n=1 Tax=Hemiselmis andersenii TaxID=464988 RepID=A0A7S0TSZ9_HEMAN